MSKKAKTKYLKDWPECPHCDEQVNPRSGVHQQSLGEKEKRSCYGCGLSFTVQRLIRYTIRAEQ